jgi:cytochrome c oxidase cbb3-type subunit 3
MGDMPSDFWSGWIIVLTVTSLVGLAWVIFSIYSTSGDPHDADEESPVWDGNLREGSNPAPLWWFWLILSLMVFSVLYLMLYPGLGSYQGALKWTQGGRLNDSMEAYEREFGGMRQLIAEANLETLQADESYMRSAQRIFDRNCAVCHGYDAAGQASMFPDLTDAEWQWGGSVAQIEQSIRGGRTGAMVSWSQILGGDEGVGRVSSYVRVLSTDAADDHPGQGQYNTFCVACHGPTGAGNVALGAPNLVDSVWLYGDSDEALHESIANGRAGEMPAFGERLDETQIRLLLALLTRPASSQ